jgi:hypothetical protein
MSAPEVCVTTSRVCRLLTLLGSAVVLAGVSAVALAPVHAQESAPPPAARETRLADIDAFMARVLERRDETWRKLHDYVLDETEQFRLLGPGAVPLHGMKREFTWYVRDGFLVRSPVKFDGVALSDSDRRAYEARWLDEERKREAEAAKRAAEKAATKETGEAPATDTASEGAPSLQDFVDQRGEPRFISEAYFLRFKFEPGNYYFAGRDLLDGRPVVKIEYYPTRLFENDRKDRDTARARRHGDDKARNRRRGEEDEFNREFNKVSLVTLWVDPTEYQIVRYTFDNMDFGFLPGRWLVRVDEARASMTMARVLDGVWLPAQIEMRAGLSVASGGYSFQYGRRFSDYRKAETSARIRSAVPRDER